MSILNLWLEPDRALIAVDTEGRADAARGSVAKLVPLPHINAVFAGRGSCEVTLTGANVCALAGVGFDALRVAFSQSMTALQSQIRRGFEQSFTAAGAEAPAFPQNQELILVGWSPENKGFRATLWTRSNDSQGWRTRDIRESHIGVWHESLAGFERPRSAALMKKLASAQVQLLRTHDPEVAAGGDLIVVELKPQGMIAGNLGPL